MVDEDFALGYVCGFNDAGGGSGDTSGIVIAKMYPFGDSGYGIGLFDYSMTGICRNRQGFDSWTADYGTQNVHNIPGPLQSSTYEWGYAAMQGNKVIGYCLSGEAIANDKLNWTHINGVWEMQDPVFPVFGGEKIIARSPGVKYTYYDVEYYLEGTVSDAGGESNYSDFIFGVQRNPNNGKGYQWSIRQSKYFYDICSGDNMLGWFTALVENGITLEEE